MANASRAVEARAAAVAAVAVEEVEEVAAVLARVVAAVEPHPIRVEVVSRQAWMVRQFRKKK